MRFLVAIVVALTATPALACLDDSDCDAGATCLKGSGIYGSCIGGKSTKAHDADPRKDIPPDTEEPADDNCTRNSDCAPGFQCLSGVCADR